MNSTIIIGAGIAGLCTAYHLVARGQNVTLIESGTIGRRASSKAAGMITPASEVRLGEEMLLACFQKSCAYYDAFVDEITGGRPELVDFSRRGSLMCAVDADGQRELERHEGFQKSMGLDVRELTRAEVAELEPNLSHRVTRALYAKNEACLDNVKLLDHLKKILVDSGRCEIMENRTITDVVASNDRMEKIRLGGPEAMPLEGDHFVLTTGLAHGIAALDEVFKLPLRPVKGQILEVAAPAGTILRSVRVSHRYPIYLVPRSDGRIVIGATSEELSDECVTAGGLMDLIYAAWQVLPGIYDFPIVDTRAGLRPAAPDHKPIFGASPIKNLFLLTGLYRHGIMAAPYLAKELVGLMNGETLEGNWGEFSVRRFCA